ncbi:MAG: hypothetical protein HS104_23845 [Polyangiaceae bacterium]|nr:hypothetical protein [Polyangiaceae bacterium]MCE7891773.1 hypothetical protein [Sorangiineae bacterium PRO1]MCL4751926.1 hypothetical protein [Myxococcales bacterium]
MRFWVISVFGALAVCAACGGRSDDSGGTGGTGGVPGLTACSKNADCIVIPKSCCGSCSGATRGDALAVNQAKAGEYRNGVCEGKGCPACYMPTDPTLVATCSSGSCELVDLLEHASTACADVAECRVRTTACCECGGPTDDEHLIAVSAESQFSALVCDDQACPECAPQYPDKTLACQGGHCVIQKQ